MRRARLVDLAVLRRLRRLRAREVAHDGELFRAHPGAVAAAAAAALAPAHNRAPLGERRLHRLRRQPPPHHLASAVHREEPAVARAERRRERHVHRARVALHHILTAARPRAEARRIAEVRGARAVAFGGGVDGRRGEQRDRAQRRPIEVNELQLSGRRAVSRRAHHVNRER